MLRVSSWILLVALLLSGVAWQARALLEARAPLPVLDALGGEFALPSTLGGVARLSDFRGQPVLLNFGYTGCPDVCPTVLARMRDLLNGLPAGEGRRVRPLFVTLDPANDDLARLGPYLAYFGDSFVGLTGSERQIREVADAYKVFYDEAPDSAPATGSIVHSAHIYLLDGDGRVRSTLGPGITVETMIARVARLLKNG